MQVNTNFDSLFMRSPILPNETFGSHLILLSECSQLLCNYTDVFTPPDFHLHQIVRFGDEFTSRSCPQRTCLCFLFSNPTIFNQYEHSIKDKGSYLQKQKWSPMTVIHKRCPVFYCDCGDLQDHNTYA